LRAQISRIVHSTTLLPDGLYDKDEEGGGVVLREEPDLKGTNDLLVHENWVFSRPGFLPSGNLKAKEVEGEEEDENVNKEAREQTMERLLKLETDKDHWKVSIQGLSDIHKLDGKDVSYGVNVLQSTRWPGAITVCYKGSYHNFYLGWGLKAKTQPFYPIYPPNILDDPLDQNEHEEPWPKTIPQDDDKKDDAEGGDDQ